MPSAVAQDARPGEAQSRESTISRTVPVLEDTGGERSGPQKRKRSPSQEAKRKEQCNEKSGSKTSSSTVSPPSTTTPEPVSRRPEYWPTRDNLDALLEALEEFHARRGRILYGLYRRTKVSNMDPQLSNLAAFWLDKSISQLRRQFVPNFEVCLQLDSVSSEFQNAARVTAEQELGGPRSWANPAPVPVRRLASLVVAAAVCDLKVLEQRVADWMMATAGAYPAVGQGMGMRDARLDAEESALRGFDLGLYDIPNLEPIG